MSQRHVQPLEWWGSGLSQLMYAQVQSAVESVMEMESRLQNQQVMICCPVEKYKKSVGSLKNIL